MAPGERGMILRILSRTGRQRSSEIRCNLNAEDVMGMCKFYYEVFRARETLMRNPIEISHYELHA
jgi:hypothetical protein